MIISHDLNFMYSYWNYNLYKFIILQIQTILGIEKKMRLFQLAFLLQCRTSLIKMPQKLINQPHMLKYGVLELMWEPPPLSEAGKKSSLS